MTLAPGCDAYEGTFEISDDGGDFDVIILGAGLAGLSAAFYLLHTRPGTRILLLEANNYAGGNAARDEGLPLPVAASTAGAFCIFPYADFLYEIYRELGIEWEKHKIESPGDCYFLDENTPGVKSGYRGWQPDLWLSPGKLKGLPYDRRIMEDFVRCAKAWDEWASKPGRPNDPPDRSSPQYDYLSEMTLAEYLLNVLHCDPSVVDFYTSYTIDCLGGTPHSVNAHSAISFLTSEYAEDCFAYPGGTAEVAARLVNWLTKSDTSDRAVEIRLRAVALRVDHGRLSFEAQSQRHLFQG